MVKVPERQMKAVKPQIKWMGARLKELRHARGLRMVDVGDHLEVGHQRVAEWESGNSDMKLSTLFRICQAIGVSPAKVFEDMPQFRRRPSKAP